MKGLLFTYVLTYGGAIVSLFNPYVGLLIYISFAIIRPEAIWGWSFGGAGHNLSEVVAVALLIGWALNGFGNWNLGKARAVVIALMGFMIWSFASAMLAASNTPFALTFVKDLAKIVLPFMVGITIIDTPQRLKQLAWVLTLSTGYVALRENETYLQWGLEAGDNFVAHAMAISAGIGFFTGLATEKWWAKLVAFGAAALCVHTVLIHMSRGAMLAVCAIAGMTFIVLPKTKGMMALYALATLVGLYMAGPSVMSEFQSSFNDTEELDSSAQSRFKLWSAMAKEAQKNPIFGLGPYHWRLNAHKHGFAKGKDGHGLWFQVPAEFGYPGAALLMSFYGFVMWRSFAMIRRKRPEHEQLIPYARLALASLSGFVIGQCFGSYYGMEIPYYVGLLGAAALKQSTFAGPPKDDEWAEEGEQDDTEPEDGEPGERLPWENWPEEAKA
jgi:O-antigen ligase